MTFIEELKWRGMLHDMTPGAEEKLASGPQICYIGFDPTAKSLTIGNYVQIMMLSLWQRTGNKPIVLMGGATGRIGDPSGKDAERQLKSFDELDKNLAKQMLQFQKLLDFDDPNTGAKMVNNLDFYKEMNVLNFLRDVGKTLTVSYMMSKDSVKNRLEKGLSFTEFSYQLLQAYDFQVLYQDYDCHFQIGGSDQWGNITSGSEFIRRNINGKAYAITTPLLTKSDGSKFGKSAEGNIWLDPDLTSPYKFYQFWINSDDADLPKYFRYFSYKSKAEVEALEKEHQNDPKALKRILAEEITSRVHSKSSFEAAKSVSDLLFSRSMSPEAIGDISAEAFNELKMQIPSYELERNHLGGDGLGIIDLLAGHTDMVKSNGDARRAIQGNAVSVNKTKVVDIHHKLTSADVLAEKYLMIENGKKNKFLVELI